MIDNVFSTTLFAIIVAVAVAAAAEIVRTDAALERSAAASAPASASPDATAVATDASPGNEPSASAAVATEMVILPTVTIIGHRPTPDSRLAARARPASAATAVRSAS